MTILQIVIGVLLVIFAIAIIAIVLLQEGNQKGLGAISGGADTFLSKNKARSIDSFLERGTKFVAIGFFVLVLVINAIMFFGNKSDSAIDDVQPETVVSEEAEVSEDVDVSSVEGAESVSEEISSVEAE